MKLSEPVVFTNNRQRKCMICNDKPMSDWLSESLKMTISGGHNRPPARQIHEEMKRAFPGRAPNSPTSVRTHLGDHEPVWRDFDEKSEAIRR